MATRSKGAAVADFLERIGWTAGQEFISVLLTTSAGASVGALPWKLAASMAAGAAVISLAATLIQYFTGLTNLSFWPDTAVRVLKTFLASLGGSFGSDVAFDVLKFNWAHAANVAAVAAIAAFGKCLLARGAPSASAPPAAPQKVTTDNPSTLPTNTYVRAVYGTVPPQQN